MADLTPLIADDHDVRIAGTASVRVMADETSLREILFNLLLNAAGALARLTVRDHGAGVAQGDVERIFGTYRQLDEASQGVGLGLFISRGMARANEADLAVTAAMGGGSSFELSLPRRREPAT